MSYSEFMYDTAADKRDTYAEIAYELRSIIKNAEELNDTDIDTQELKSLLEYCEEKQEEYDQVCAECRRTEEAAHNYDID